ncbi:hypothetical protein KSP39_PZI005418 [Platanthera zijinensis]|uniref:RING-type domain-containing protein n=1 Tax=Platanthera zijinensis TaxID=2320716 RepID=A0AAP0BST0_9ASPA
MSSVVSPKRSMKKCARDASRRKSTLTIDLNTPPAVSETVQPEGTWEGPAPTAVAVVDASTARMIVSPIDVEAIDDDDVQMLFSPRVISQERTPFRNQPVTVVLDEEQELGTGASVINVDDHPLQAPLSSFRRRRRLSPNRVIINCETYVNVEDDQNAKRKKRANPKKIEQEKAVAAAAAKEPVFSCPICMNPLADACSTICGHVFCQACIKQALQAQKKCPTCRRKLTINNFHRVFLPITS